MRTARQTILIAVVLALPYLVTGLISDGPNAGRLIRGGIVLLVIAGAAAFMVWRGRRLDEAQGERAEFIVGKAMRSGCWWRCGRPSAWATSTTRCGTDDLRLA